MSVDDNLIEQFPARRQHLREVEPGRFLINEIAVIKTFTEAFRLYAPASTHWTAGVEAAVRTQGAALATVLQAIQIELEARNAGRP